MNAAWTQHLKTPTEQEEMRQILNNSQYTFRRLRDIILERKKTLEASEMTITDFDSPSWAVKQAFRNGQRSQIKFVEDLLDFVK